jgi:hypothetical protein
MATWIGDTRQAEMTKLTSLSTKRTAFDTFSTQVLGLLYLQYSTWRRLSADYQRNGLKSHLGFGRSAKRLCLPDAEDAIMQYLMMVRLIPTMNMLVEGWVSLKLSSFLLLKSCCVERWDFHQIMTVGVIL